MGKAIVTLGADPEFELIIAGRAESAAGILGDAIHLPWGSIGVDGAGWPLELRPEPSINARGLVHNVARLLVAVPKILGGLPSTVGEAYAIGGHIHVGINTPVDERALVRALDEAIGDILYSLSPASRIEAGYGRRRDWRIQPWGIEYRTPPAAIWSHPQVATIFVGAIKWAAGEFLRGRDPLRSPALPKIRGAAKSAAAFVRQYGGRLHWGAWEASLGETEVDQYLGAKTMILGHGLERDTHFVDDMKAMCDRLGIKSLRILPSYRGDFATNIPGYGTPVGDFVTFTPGGTLFLSWRFRNDPKFRREELPKLEAAIATLIETNEKEGDGGRLVKEVIHLSGKRFFRKRLERSSSVNTTPNESKKSDSDFEKRVEARRRRILAANSHRRFQCVACGEIYDYRWVYEYGMRCHAECDHLLAEVTP